jgi:hypothetical protein
VRRRHEPRQFRLFDAVEQTLERVVEGSIGRLLPSRLQPAEIARRLEREMTIQQVVSIDGPIAPNAFRVMINPAEAAQLDGLHNRLTDDLVAWLDGIRIERGIQMVGAISVALEADERVPARTIRVTAVMIEDSQPEAGAFREEPVSVAYALEFTDRHGFARSIRLREGFTIIGRAPASDIVLEDPSVSRFHARLEVSGRRIDVRDLDSTNGTRVNGHPVNAAPLEVGDEITFGSVDAWIALSGEERDWR